jgi:hypothetical protein
MKTNDFNAEAKTPRYGYVPSPVNPRAFQIVKYANSQSNDPKPVGDYTVLDSKEDPGLTEKKVMNLVTLLNGRKSLMQLGHETNARILYHVVSEHDDDGKARIVFYHLGKEGVSIENALFRIEKDENVT